MYLEDQEISAHDRTISAWYLRHAKRSIVGDGFTIFGERSSRTYQALICDP
jgi:hypothetical protein